MYDSVDKNNGTEPFMKKSFCIKATKNLCFAISVFRTILKNSKRTKKSYSDFIFIREFIEVKQI